MRAREPNSSHWTRQVRKRRHYHRQWSGSNSWPISSHRTCTRELAVSCPSTILHVGGGRSVPSNFWCFWYDELWNNRVSIYDKLSLIAQDILAAPASQAYIEMGFSVCGLLTAGRRNRMTKSLQMQAFLKLNKKVLANTGVNAFVWTLELSLNNGNELQIS